jgi:hypothetical protein
MSQKLRVTRVFTALVLAVAVSAALRARAQSANTPYPTMAPVEQYLMERTAEISLARTAAPESVSRDAEFMILGRHGYKPP